MTKDSLAAAARGDSVTADRLAAAVVAALDDEQPHHLLRGLSVDLDGDDGGRRFPSTDASAWVVATDDRLLFVVPESLGSVVEAVAYDEVTATTASDPPGSGGEFAVETAVGSYRAYLADGEDPAPLREFVERAAAGDLGEPDERVADVNATSSTPATDAPGGEPAATDPSDGGDAAGAAEDGGTGDTGGDDDGDDPLETIRRLDELREDGIIDDEEFERKKAKLLDQI